MIRRLCQTYHHSSLHDGDYEYRSVSLRLLSRARCCRSPLMPRRRVSSVFHTILNICLSVLLRVPEKGRVCKNEKTECT